MASNLLNDKDWQKLLKIFEQGECVLMLGSDIPSGQDNAQPPLFTLLARQLAGQMEGGANTCDPDDLPHVAQNYLAKRVGDQMDLQLEAENFYKAYQGATTHLHQSLAQLPFKYCITTTPDDAMRNAFESVSKKPLRAYYHFTGKNQSLPATPTPITPLIYQLCGTSTDSSSLVLSETDLLDFLANIIAGQPEVPPALSKVLSDRKTSFIFIGFGFQRWYLRVLLHLFRSKLQIARPWSVALENTRFFTESTNQQITWFYGETHAIEFKNSPWNSFADELSSRYRQQTATATITSEPSLPEDAPTVFLCHCSDDSEAVGELGHKLRAKGLNTWRDRDNLRGGDNWDRKIKHLIDSGSIDYVLVLQTPNMLAKSASYFVSEIKSALERQKFHWDEFIFIIPAFLAGDGITKLEALQHLNYRDLRQDHNLDKLVQDIFDDRNKRLVRKDVGHE